MAGSRDPGALDCYVRVEPPRAAQAAILENEVSLTPLLASWLSQPDSWQAGQALTPTQHSDASGASRAQLATAFVTAQLPSLAVQNGDSGQGSTGFAPIM